MCKINLELPIILPTFASRTLNDKCYERPTVEWDIDCKGWEIPDKGWAVFNRIGRSILRHDSTALERRLHHALMWTPLPEKNKSSNDACAVVILYNIAKKIKYPNIIWSIFVLISQFCCQGFLSYICFVRNGQQYGNLNQGAGLNRPGYCTKKYKPK